MVALAVFLPWANVSSGHDVNLSPRAAAGIKSALSPRRGGRGAGFSRGRRGRRPADRRQAPVRLSMLPCVVVALAGLGIAHFCFSAGGNVWDPLRPGSACTWPRSRRAAGADRSRFGDGRLRRPDLAGIMAPRPGRGTPPPAETSRAPASPPHSVPPPMVPTGGGPSGPTRGVLRARLGAISGALGEGVAQGLLSALVDLQSLREVLLDRAEERRRSRGAPPRP